MAQIRFIISTADHAAINAIISNINHHPGMMFQLNIHSPESQIVTIHNRPMDEIQEFLSQFVDKTPDYRLEMID